MVPPALQLPLASRAALGNTPLDALDETVDDCRLQLLTELRRASTAA